ncbi:MAG: type II toxin-antitoxin system RelB/DinJ family antitoxin [Lachnospiraceae bacterium]|nr:type II toxin-antitoxin system RelB/DinJ family antitoxin [Lachnospiraceae bacterium]
MSSTIQIRVDDDLKRKSDRLFRDLGTDTTSAIRIFLTQAVANNGFPFEIKRNSVDMSAFTTMSEDEMLEKLSAAREHSAQGKQREAAAVISDMRSKYGL